MKPTNGWKILASKRRKGLWVWEEGAYPNFGGVKWGYYDAKGHGLPEELLDTSPTDFVGFESHEEFEKIIKYLDWARKNYGAEKGEGDEGLVCHNCGQEFYGYEFVDSIEANGYKIEMECHCGTKLRFSAHIGLYYRRWDY